jgi:hypothetical protein
MNEKSLIPEILAILTEPEPNSIRVCGLTVCLSVCLCNLQLAAQMINL